MLPALAVEAQQYSVALSEWLNELPALALADLIEEAQGPKHVSLYCVDLVNGFCYEGPLCSSRVAAIVPAIVSLFERAHDLGIRNFVLPQDSHHPNAAEFASFPPHCIQGSHESQTVAELARLPFAAEFVVIPKNSLHPAYGTGFDEWNRSHPEISHRIVVGDCTDLCVFQLAMHLLLQATAANRRCPVIVPASCVDTYDLPPHTARAAGLQPHPANLLHAAALHNMAINGVRVVSSVV
ncbi:MAG TPA: isochorismatase family cysteine hydrolase [Chthonomonadales bacterium]|nr:isochorismatase family cysteine hydrolase [Chthonomonadales bacterium]